MDSVDSLKVVELRSELQKRGLSSAGVKAELVKRLMEAMQKDEEVSGPGGAEEWSCVADEANKG